MRVACLDLGSNSLLVTVAGWKDRTLKSVHEDVYLIRLAENLHPEGKLSPAARSRCFQALDSARRTLQDHDVDTALGVATEALRRASDGPQFLEEIRNRFDLSFRILSAREEAGFTFKAIQKEFSHLDSDLVAFDIGGGSTEIVSGTSNAVFSVTTLDFGTVSVTERFIHNDPILDEEMEELMAWTRSRLERFPSSSVARTALGIGGTVTTLKAVALEMDPYDSSRIHGSILSRSQVEDLLGLFLSMTTRKRAGLKGLSPQRADIIPAGAAITAAIMDRLNREEILVSDRGLRWGVLYDWAEKNG